MYSKRFSVKRFDTLTWQTDTSMYIPQKLWGACRAKLYQLSSLNEQDEVWYTCRDQKKVESVFSAHYTCTCQLDSALVVQEQLQSQVLVKVNISFVAINSFPCRLLAVQKKLFVESGQIVLANINR